MSIKRLTEEESLAAMEMTVKRALDEVAMMTEAELKATPSATTGACCLYTFGVSSCTSSTTYNACRQAAANTGTVFQWTANTSCSSVRCPPS